MINEVAIKILVLVLIQFSVINNTNSQDLDVDERNTGYLQNKVLDSSSQKWANQENRDIVTVEERSLASLWMLTVKDWEKYKTLMAGPRGIWSPGLDPITTLGVSETDESERRRYADIWMKVESRKVELELAFEVERMDAAKRLHGNTKIVNNDAWISEWKKKHRDIKNKISLFINANCISECNEYFKSVMDSTGDKSVLDIYFAAGATSESAGTWARAMNIDPNVVKSKKITLNFDKGASSILKVDMSNLPQVRVLDVASGEIKKTFVR